MRGCCAGFGTYIVTGCTATGEMAAANVCNTAPQGTVVWTAPGFMTGQADITGSIDTITKTTTVGD